MDMSLKLKAGCEWEMDRSRMKIAERVPDKQSID